MLIAAIVAVVLVIVALKSVVVVPAETAFVVERLGRCHRTLPAGRHFVAPFVDRVASRFTTRTAHNRLSETAITHDHVPVRIASTFFARIGLSPTPDREAGRLPGRRRQGGADGSRRRVIADCLVSS